MQSVGVVMLHQPNLVHPCHKQIYPFNYNKLYGKRNGKKELEGGNPSFFVP